MSDVYHTVEKPATGYYKDKGSKFYSFAYPVQNENDVKEILQNLKKEHHSARHHCYAWRIGTEQIAFRANDDGEPASTAGKPILGQLIRFDVTNILVVVVRYFGGTLLGVSGLINAYKNAAEGALNNAEIVTHYIEKQFQLDFTYPGLNQVMQIIKNENLTVLNTQFKEACRLLFSVRKSKAKRIQQRFEKFYGVNIKPL